MKKEKSVWVDAIILGAGISLIGIVLYYFGGFVLKDDIISSISLVILSPSILLSLKSYSIVSPFMRLGFNQILIIIFHLFICSFIVWTAFFYLIIDLYASWKIKKEIKYLFTIIFISFVFLLISLAGFFIANAMREM